MTLISRKRWPPYPAPRRTLFENNMLYFVGFTESVTLLKVDPNTLTVVGKAAPMSPQLANVNTMCVGHACASPLLTPLGSFRKRPPTTSSSSPWCGPTIPQTAAPPSLSIALTHSILCARVRTSDELSTQLPHCDVQSRSPRPFSRPSLRSVSLPTIAFGSLTPPLCTLLYCLSFVYQHVHTLPPHPQ